MTTTLEINEAFADQASLVTSGLIAELTQPSPEGRSLATEVKTGTTAVRYKDWDKTLGWILTSLVVVGLGTVAGWAVVLIFNSLAQQTGGRYSSVITWFGITFAVYVLSTGPAARLVQAGYLPRAPFDIFYAPLVAVAPEHTPQGAVLEWYVFSLWKVEMPPIK